MEEKDFQESKGKQLSLAVEASGEHPHPDPQGESAEVKLIPGGYLGGRVFLDIVSLDRIDQVKGFKYYQDKQSSTTKQGH